MHESSFALNQSQFARDPRDDLEVDVGDRCAVVGFGAEFVQAEPELLGDSRSLVEPLVEIGQRLHC